MPIMVQKDKWILYKHTSNYEIIKAIALDVKNSCRANLSESEKHRMQERQAALDLYKTRNPQDRPLDAMNHRINTLEFFMFGYENKFDGKHSFIFSPLGNLFLDRIDYPEKQKRIFEAMLFAMQYQHPASGTAKSFRLFPFRLIFKLLCDERLDKRLFNSEYALLISQIKQINDSSYEKLVTDILQLRSKTNVVIFGLMKQDEHAFVNAIYEWQYYMERLLMEIGIINVCKGRVIGILYHPSKTNSHSNPTGRKVTDGYITLPTSEIPFIEKMLHAYPYSAIPLKLDDPERLKLDVIKEIYSFFPRLLLEDIGEHINDDQIALLQLPELIEAYSNNPDNQTAYLFEEVLTFGMNMFTNVEAKRMGGAGHTDIECLYLTRKSKFAVDAKSTEHKLPGINCGRLREHREEIGGEYTIVITSRYVPAAKRDIIGTPNVILLASTFAEYLYNHIQQDIRNIDFKEFDDIILSRLGTDISKDISDLTLNKFASTAY